mgnify:CR=1 FL=1
MISNLEKLDLVPPDKVKGFFGSYYPPPELASHFINNKLEEIYSVKRVHIIVNPFAGKKNGNKIANLISQELQELKIDSITYTTEYANHAEKIVSDISFETGDSLMSVGGDGTISEIITGLLKRKDSSSDNVPLSIVPSGSGNSQANDMEVADYLDAMQRMTVGNLRKMDVGKVTFMVDGKDHPTASDKSLASLIRESGKKFILAVNKCDTLELDKQAYGFHELGMDPICSVSALNGRLTGDLLDLILDQLQVEGADQINEIAEGMRMAIVGMPNVGKSSITNALLQKEQAIVTPIAGTTRDSIDSKLKYYGKSITLVDTAGLRKKSKLDDNIEFRYLMCPTNS